jgi:hypothetical protein
VTLPVTKVLRKTTQSLEGFKRDGNKSIYLLVNPLKLVEDKDGGLLDLLARATPHGIVTSFMYNG